MYGYIYKTTNLINGKIYIGQHKGKYDNAYFGSGKLITRAILKYGIENFKNEVVEWCETREKLCEKEIYWIKTLQPFPTNCKGYNLSAGGEFGNITAGYTDEQINEWKKKISKSKKGNRTWLGKNHSNETKMKISKSRTGYKASEEAKKAISKGITGGKNPRAKHFLATYKNNNTKRFETCNDACKCLNVSQYKLLKMVAGNENLLNKANLLNIKEINRNEYK